MLFKEIPGLEHTKDGFIKAVKNNHIAHAQMLFGMRGSANLATALSYATYLNCESPLEDDSCGTCPSCVKMNKLIHPDLHLVFPVYGIAKSKDYDKERNAVLAQFRTSIQENPYLEYEDWVKSLDVGSKQCIINVQEGRNIIRNISLKSFESKYKIVLIWLPEYMNVECANAILKVLEEPPQRTIFLLVTNDVEKNITTIISRSQIATIPSFSDENIKNTLSIKHPEATSDQIDKAAMYSDGNINRALELIHEVSDEHHEIFKNWMRYCFSKKFDMIVTLADDFQKLSKQNQKGLFEYAIHIFRELVFHHNQANELIRIPDAEKDFLDKFATVVKQDKLEPVYKLLNEGIYHLERNANPKITFTNLSFKITQVFTHAH